MKGFLISLNCSKACSFEWGAAELPSLFYTNLRDLSDTLLLHSTLRRGRLIAYRLVYFISNLLLFVLNFYLGFNLFEFGEDEEESDPESCLDEGLLRFYLEI
jgi:hypothetical protein